MLRPDLLIADVVLRALDGIELLREVRRDSQIGDTPIILWSVVYQPHQIRAFVGHDQRFIALDKRICVEALATTVNGLLPSTDGDGPKGFATHRSPPRCLVSEPIGDLGAIGSSKPTLQNRRS